MKREGASYVLLHSDALPNPFLEFVASRAKTQGLQSIAWIQRPTTARIDKVGQLDGFKAIQVDDHFFATPFMTFDQLRKEAKGKKVWCSFQPSQYTWEMLANVIAMTFRSTEEAVTTLQTLPIHLILSVIQELRSRHTTMAGSRA